MPENLTTKELQDLVRFFTYTMGMDQRGKLMAEMPLVYAKLYPDVDPEIIVQKVRYQMMNKEEK